MNIVLRCTKVECIPTGDRFTINGPKEVAFKGTFVQVRQDEFEPELINGPIELIHKHAWMVGALYTVQIGLK